jgi:hypothetical protein
MIVRYPMRHNALRFISLDYAVLIALTTPANFRTYDYATLIAPTTPTASQLPYANLKLYLLTNYKSLPLSFILYNQLSPLH